MADNALSMSLDDLIKKNRETSKKPRGGKAGGKGRGGKTTTTTNVKGGGVGKGRGAVKVVTVNRNAQRKQRVSTGERIWVPGAWGSAF